MGELVQPDVDYCLKECVEQLCMFVYRVCFVMLCKFWKDLITNKCFCICWITK